MKNLLAWHFCSYVLIILMSAQFRLSAQSEPGHTQNRLFLNKCPERLIGHLWRSVHASA